MELNTKVKELEDELKVLKAEIRNVLLDIREVILDRTNPLAEEHQSAFIRMDLNTTARALASEAGAREAAHAVEQAQATAHGEAEHPRPADRAADPPAAAQIAAEQPAAAQTAAEQPAAAQTAAEQPGSVQGSAEQEPGPKEKGGREGKKAKTSAAGGSSPEPALAAAEIPPMYRAATPVSGSALALTTWITEAIGSIGPQQVDRIITIHRLCGTLPPNVSEALAHLQELIRSSEDQEIRWLKTPQDLESLT